MKMTTRNKYAPFKITIDDSYVAHSYEFSIGGKRSIHTVAKRIARALGKKLPKSTFVGLSK